MHDKTSPYRHDPRCTQPTISQIEPNFHYLSYDLFYNLKIQGLKKALGIKKASVSFYGKGNEIIIKICRATADGWTSLNDPRH